jgi:hypothetical protein
MATNDRPSSTKPITLFGVSPKGALFYRRVHQVRAFRDDHPKAAADPKEFFDNRFLKELEESGFVQELSGKR